MKIVHDNIAVLDMGSQDLLSSWIMECGKLCHDDGVAIHYLPHITPGRVVVDAGAALGDHTISYIQKAGRADLVHAFECNPEMVECLRHNCPGVHVHPVALSDRYDTLWFHRDSTNTNIGMSHVSGTEKSKVQVNAIPLDSLRLEDVCFIKWDLEGYEAKAIAGARDTIRRCQPIMMVEAYPELLRRASDSLEVLYQILGSLEYSWHAVMGDSTIPDERLELLCKPQ